MRAIAVDWSGDQRAARKHIWLAEAGSSGDLIRLECGRDRDELTVHLLTLARSDLVIGFDFAFSFPAWYLAELGLADAPALWVHVATHAESWLARCLPPFWGRPGRPRPLAREPEPALRRTDAAVPRTAGVAPKSIFQIGGAGAVGTGSLRGMSVLHQLHTAGARIWPFTDAGSPLILEIYPRLFTGPVRKSNPLARAALLDARYPSLSPEHRRLASNSEDAFDAAVSALEMHRYLADLTALPTEGDPIARLEGRIWHPHWREEPL